MRVDVRFVRLYVFLYARGLLFVRLYVSLYACDSLFFFVCLPVCVLVCALFVCMCFFFPTFLYVPCVPVCVWVCTLFVSMCVCMRVSMCFSLLYVYLYGCGCVFSSFACVAVCVWVCTFFRLYVCLCLCGFCNLLRCKLHVWIVLTFPNLKVSCVEEEVTSRRLKSGKT